MDILSNIQWLIVGIVLCAGAIAFNVWYDLRLWFKEKRRPHKKGWRLKAVTSAPALIALSFASNFIWVVSLIVTSILLMCLFLLFFDGFYNTFRGFGFWYRGSNDLDDASTDDFFQSIPIWAGVALKILLVSGSILLYIIGYST